MSQRPPAPFPAELPALPRRSRLSLMAGLFAAVLLGVAWLSVWMVLKGRHDDAVEAERRQNINLALVLEEQATRVLAPLDQATRRVRDAVIEQPGRTPDLVRFANETGLAPAILVQLSLVGADGHFVGSNLDPDGSKSQHVDLSSREHVRAHLAPQTLPVDAPRPSADGLFIGRPVLGKVSGRWTIQLSRGIRDAQGRLLGVVVASLDPGYFEEVFRRVRLGSEGSVALTGADRTVRARVVHGEAVGMGSSIPPESQLAQHMTEAGGSYIGASGVDGVVRLVAFRRVGDYPLFITVSTGLEDALSEWRRTRDIVVGLTVLLSLAILGAATSFVLGLRRLERTNEALRLSEAQAQAASQAKSEFLAAISHELRTPLTSIRGFAELMEQRLEHPMFREQAGLIRKGAEYLNSLLSEILDLAKVEVGAMELNPTPVSVRTLVEGTVDFFSVSALEKGLTLETRLAPDLPEALLCDSLRLKQVLNNLLSNAVKFTDQGSVTVDVERDEQWLRVHVRDTGPGIEPALQETIFEKFRQGNARVSYEHGGTGLGLALARALAERMGGRLTLDSQPGQGSCFTLELPLVDA